MYNHMDNQFLLPPVYNLLIQFNIDEEFLEIMYIESEHKTTFYLAIKYGALILKKFIIKMVDSAGSSMLLVRKGYIPVGLLYLVK